MRKAAARAMNNRLALVLSAAIGFVLAYALATRAIDTDSYWQYLGCVVFLGLSIKLLIRAVMNSYGKR